MSVVEKDFPKEKIPLSRFRIKGIDTARGVAGAFITLAHFIHWYALNIPHPSLLTDAFFLFMVNPFQLMYFTLPGMGVILQLYVSRRRGINENILKKMVIKRGLLLIIIQFFCNFFFYKPHFTWTWFILSFIGVTLIISYYLSKMSIKIRLIIIIILVALAPFLKYWCFGFYFSLSGGINTHTWAIKIFLHQMFLGINFPVFALLSYPIFGTILADLLIKSIETKTEYKFVKKYLIIGIIMIVIYYLTRDFNYIFNFPNIELISLPTRQEIILEIGEIMVIITVFFWLQDLKGKDWKVFRALNIYGGITLTIFIIHFYVFPIFLPVPIDNKMIEYSVYQIFFAIDAVYWVYAVIVLRRNRKYSIEWLMRVLS